MCLNLYKCTKSHLVGKCDSGNCRMKNTKPTAYQKNIMKKPAHRVIDHQSRGKEHSFSPRATSSLYSRGERAHQCRAGTTPVATRLAKMKGRTPTPLIFKSIHGAASPTARITTDSPIYTR